MDSNTEQLQLGTHYIVEYYDCDRKKIDDPVILEKIMLDATMIAGARIIRPFFHQFSPQGVSGVIVIAESHFAIHTWPEHGYVAVDLFSCADFNYRAALKHILAAIGARRHSAALVRRGLVEKTGPIPALEYFEIDG